MGVRIIGFPDEYDRGFYPFIKGFRTDILSVRDDIRKYFFPLRKSDSCSWILPPPLKRVSTIMACLPIFLPRASSNTVRMLSSSISRTWIYPDLSLREGIGLLAPEPYPSFCRAIHSPGPKKWVWSFLPSGYGSPDHIRIIRSACLLFDSGTGNGLRNP